MGLQGRVASFKKLRKGRGAQNGLGRELLRPRAHLSRARLGALRNRELSNMLAEEEQSD